MRIHRSVAPHMHTSVHHPPHRFYLVMSLMIAMVLAFIVVTSVTYFVAMLLN